MKDIRICFLVLAAMAFSASPAQRKELSQARTILKSGKRVEEAEKLMTNLLKDTVNRTNKRIYALWYESVLMQYQAVNEKLYMKQKQDTAQFYNLTRRLFTVAETLDSLDARPNNKGKVSLEYRQENAEQLLKYRPNLYYACTYFIRKGDYKTAYAYGEAYMDCARQPLFADHRLDSLDARMPEVAYWTTYCGYRQDNPVLTLRYRQLALQDTARRESTLQFIAEARRQLKDDSLYVATLRKGFAYAPENNYFFPRLMDFYNTRGDYQRALSTVDEALRHNSRSELFLFAKSTVLFNIGRYDESIALSDTLIAMNDSLPEPYYNAGTAYINKALKLHPLREKKQVRSTYSLARPYMERYRKLAPQQKQKWGPALYRIYLNLNMGKQFDEIDRLLKE
jgi:hypothetical protein